MSQIIKRPFRTDNGTDWDKHYFETSADQIKDGVIVSLEDLDLVTEKGCLIDALVAKQINSNLTNLGNFDEIVHTASDSTISLDKNIYDYKKLIIMMIAVETPDFILDIKEIQPSFFLKYPQVTTFLNYNDGASRICGVHFPSEKSVKLNYRSQNVSVKIIGIK